MRRFVTKVLVSEENCDCLDVMKTKAANTTWPVIAYMRASRYRLSNQSARIIVCLITDKRTLTQASCTAKVENLMIPITNKPERMWHFYSHHDILHELPFHLTPHSGFYSVAQSFFDNKGVGQHALWINLKTCVFICLIKLITQIIPKSSRSHPRLRLALVKMAKYFQAEYKNTYKDFRFSSDTFQVLKNSIYFFIYFTPFHIREHNDKHNCFNNLLPKPQRNRRCFGK